jgi:hypothetical protein
MGKNTAVRRRHPRSKTCKITVPEEIIALSTKKDSGTCMIAESIRRQIPEARSILVDLATIRYSDLEKGFRYTYLTPRKAQLALIDFDQGRVPEPFEFTLYGGQVTRAGTKRKVAAPPSAEQQDAAASTPSGEAPPPPEPGTNAAIRVWGRQQGWTVSDRGQVPAQLRAEYIAAHPGTVGQLAEASGPRRLVIPPNGNRDSIPVVVGGETPPVGVLAGGAIKGGALYKIGRRRQFGLRILER